MGLLLVPKEATQSTALVWVGSTEEVTEPLELAVGPRRVAVDGVWTRFPADQPTRLWGQEVSVDVADLPAGRHRVTLRSADRRVASAQLTVLPPRLPASQTEAFTVLLASCYWVKRDGGRIARAFDGLPATLKPDLKILCGDQVYLDAPVGSFWLTTGRKLERRHLGRYLDSWGATGAHPGLGPLLGAGANLFSSDDHEFWNNYPTPTATAFATMRQGKRRAWDRSARQLYAMLQRLEPVRCRVDPLSIFVADTRVDRTRGTHKPDRRRPPRHRFIDEEALDDIADWIGGLDGPGLLVLGQPLLAGRHGVKGHMFDWGLADYAQQYERLTAAVADAQHSVVVLTGDVHFSRVARTLGWEFVEVISSPMAVISTLMRGEAKHYSGYFPAGRGRDKPRRIKTDDGLLTNEEGFLLLRFWRRGGRVETDVVFCPASGDAPRTVDRLTLH